MKELACVVVTYRPDLAVLARLLVAVPAEAAVILVDNASGDGIPDELTRLLAARRRSHLIRNDHNAGLATAINQGVRAARERWPDARYALLLDQDTEPEAGAIAVLMRGVAQLRHAEPPPGAVGPTLIDSATGMSHGFHRSTRWRWTRVYPPRDRSEPVACASLNGSGTLVSIRLFLELGGLEEALFIDHVDTEWGFRVRAAGYGLYGIPAARFVHRMGRDSRRIWLFGWRIWPVRTPARHYYLFRNGVVLLRRRYVPRVWKSWAIMKLLLTAGVHAGLGPGRGAQLGRMLAGVRDGLRGDTRRR